MDAKLTQEELQAIKERAEKATEGPWENAWNFRCVVSNDEDLIICGELERDVDAEFIAAARQDIPKLLSEIERLQAEVHEHSAHNGQLIATHVIPMKEENKRLRKALEFYANEVIYDNPILHVDEDGVLHCDHSDAELDNGKIAREALK